MDFCASRSARKRVASSVVSWCGATSPATTRTAASVASCSLPADATDGSAARDTDRACIPLPAERPAPRPAVPAPAANRRRAAPPLAATVRSMVGESPHGHPQKRWKSDGGKCGNNKTATEKKCRKAVEPSAVAQGGPGRGGRRGVRHGHDRDALREATSRLEPTGRAGQLLPSLSLRQVSELTYEIVDRTHRGSLLSITNILWRKSSRPRPIDKTHSIYSNLSSTCRRRDLRHGGRPWPFKEYCKGDATL